MPVEVVVAAAADLAVFASVAAAATAIAAVVDLDPVVAAVAAVAVDHRFDQHRPRMPADPPADRRSDGNPWAFPHA